MKKLSAEPLTDRQRAVLCLLDRYRKEGKEIPSLMYLARDLQVHHSTLQEHLSELHRKGHLRAPVPGPPIREIPAPPPLPIPPRDEPEDAVEAAASPPAGGAQLAKASLPALPPTVVVEKHTPLGATAPTSVTVRTLRRTRTFRVLRVAGQITGFEVEET